MFALPDFRGGAMENWALITYRESAMLIEDDVASETNLQYLAGIIEHELAHMVCQYHLMFAIHMFAVMNQ